MSRLGKCQNLSGCLLAYRGEQTEVPDDQPFVCAECGKPLTEQKRSQRKLISLVIGGVLLVVLAAAIVGLPKIMGGIRARPSKRSLPTPAPAEASREAASEAASIVSPAKEGDAEPPERVMAEPRINLSIDPLIKREVLKRIDLMPGISAANKDKLYNSVERARKMGLVLTVPFLKGKTTLAPQDALGLKAELEKPEVARLRNDPTAVFVILGYADPKGDAKMNLEFSQKRADAVVGALKRDAGLLNVVHAVAMGGSTLLDAKNLEKNRIAEVWIVLP